jgi:cupin superfamily acireductone dioxygenase involved in methionine salvage
VKIVEEMWEADRVKKESVSKQEKIENLKNQIERLSESYGLKIKNVDIE